MQDGCLRISALAVPSAWTVPPRYLLPHRMGIKINVKCTQQCLTNYYHHFHVSLSHLLQVFALYHVALRGLSRPRFRLATHHPSSRFAFLHRTQTIRCTLPVTSVCHPPTGTIVPRQKTLFTSSCLVHRALRGAGQARAKPSSSQLPLPSRTTPSPRGPLLTPSLPCPPPGP